MIVIFRFEFFKLILDCGENWLERRHQQVHSQGQNTVHGSIASLRGNGFLDIPNFRVHKVHYFSLY